MRHLPGLGPFDDTALVVDGHLRLMAALAILAVFVMYAVLLWSVRRTRRESSRPKPGAGKGPRPDDSARGTVA